MGRAVMGAATLGGSELLRSAGLNGEQGDYYSPKNQALDEINQRNSVYSNPSLQAAFNNVNSAQGIQGALGGLSGAQADEGRNAILSDAISGRNIASNQVANDQILGQLYGKDSSLSRAVDQEKAMLAPGANDLTKGDREAYGQASDDIARQFGQNENSLAASLAGRGLAQGGGGVVGAQFAGLQGNKNEQLANQQRQIAQQRIQSNQQQLANTRQYLSQTGQGAQNAINSQYNAQVNTGQQRRDNLNQTAGLQSAFNEQLRNAQADKEAAVGQTPEGLLAQGFGNALRQAPSAALGAATKKATGGGLGSAS